MKENENNEAYYKMSETKLDHQSSFEMPHVRNGNNEIDMKSYTKRGKRVKKDRKSHFSTSSYLTSQ